MSTKWHFKNNAAQAQSYRPLDTNPADYGAPIHHEEQQSDRNNYTEGVLITFVDGSSFKTRDFTVDDIYDAIHTDKSKWLKLENGGEINLDYVERYIPFKFFEYPKYGYHNRNYEWRGNQYRDRQQIGRGGNYDR